MLDYLKNIENTLDNFIGSFYYRHLAKFNQEGLTPSLMHNIFDKPSMVDQTWLGHSEDKITFVMLNNYSNIPKKINYYIRSLSNGNTNVVIVVGILKFSIKEKNIFLYFAGISTSYIEYILYFMLKHYREFSLSSYVKEYVTEIKKSIKNSKSPIIFIPEGFHINGNSLNVKDAFYININLKYKYPFTINYIEVLKEYHKQLLSQILSNSSKKIYFDSLKNQNNIAKRMPAPQSDICTFYTNLRQDVLPQ